MSLVEFEVSALGFPVERDIRGAQQAVTVDEAEMIATSFPDFAGFMRALGADIAEA